MELGMLEAARVNSPSIGSGHLLLGLIREGQSPAAQVLTALGADLERARDAERVVREGTEPEA
jgi:ATP-dependent Clp protease ATP-binding subunit ClpC